jgi:hypothetical protein
MVSSRAEDIENCSWWGIDVADLIDLQASRCQCVHMTPKLLDPWLETCC